MITRLKSSVSSICVAGCQSSPGVSAYPGLSYSNLAARPGYNFAHTHRCLTPATNQEPRYWQFLEHRILNTWMHDIVVNHCKHKYNQYDKFLSVITLAVVTVNSFCSNSYNFMKTIYGYCQAEWLFLCTLWFCIFRTVFIVFGMFPHKNKYLICKHMERWELLDISYSIRLWA